MIALMQPSHYVLVEAVTPAEVDVWDPDGRRKRYSREDWSRRWQGLALVPDHR